MLSSYIVDFYSNMYNYSLLFNFICWPPTQNCNILVTQDYSVVRGTTGLTFCYDAGTNASTEFMSTVRNWPRMNAKVSSFSFLMNFMHSYWWLPKLSFLLYFILCKWTPCPVNHAFIVWITELILALNYLNDLIDTSCIFCDSDMEIGDGQLPLKSTNLKISIDCALRLSFR